MRILLTFLFILAIQANASQVKLPEGWRLPTEKELSGEERDNQHNSTNSDNRFSQAQGDYNGDGLIDKAYILVSTEFNGDGLFLYISDNGKYSWLPLEIDNWDKSYPDKNYIYTSPNMGIGTLSSETFRRYVKKAWVTPDDIVPTENDFSNPALDYFRFESAGSLYFWSNTENRFVRFWYSD